MAVNGGVRPISLISSYESNTFLDNYELQKAADLIWAKIQACDEFIQRTEPFKTIKTDKAKAEKDIEHLLTELNQIALSLQPFLPHTSEQILAVLKDPKPENIPKLFPRIEHL
jgi:methionyl-tRNA synthetase